MTPITIKASNYTSRSDLEDYIRNEIGDNIDENRKAGHTIEGTEDELRALGLSGTTRIFGIKCIINNQF